MIVKLRKIGNSVGNVYPAAILAELDAHSGDEIEVEIKRVVRHPRHDWDKPEAFAGGLDDHEMLLDDEPTQWDEEEWTW